MKSIGNVPSLHENEKQIRFTPRELIKFHMEHPEIPIRDEDIENLILDFPDISTWNDADTDSDLSYTSKSTSTTTMLL